MVPFTTTRITFSHVVYCQRYVLLSTFSPFFSTINLHHVSLWTYVPCFGASFLLTIIDLCTASRTYRLLSRRITLHVPFLNSFLHRVPKCQVCVDHIRSLHSFYSRYSKYTTTSTLDRIPLHPFDTINLIRGDCMPSLFHAPHILDTTYSLLDCNNPSLSTRTSAVVKLTSTEYVP